MSSKYKEFFEASLRKESEESKVKKRSISFDEKHTLPKELKSRDSMEKGFKKYLSNKNDVEEGYERRYISPPFEVSKVPSPVYGYNRPQRNNKKPTDYSKLKKEMAKEAIDFILFEETINTDNKELNKEQKKIANAKQKAKPHIRKGYGLHRTLASIIEEEKSGDNGDKSEVPGLFLPDKKR